MSTDDDWQDGDFDGKGHTISGELLPRALTLDGVAFQFGSSGQGAKNVLVPKGQTLALPAGAFDRVYVLAAAVGGDVPVTVGLGATSPRVTVQEWEGAIGQWDSRLKDPGDARAVRAVEPRAACRRSRAKSATAWSIQWDPQTFTVTRTSTSCGPASSSATRSRGSARIGTRVTAIRSTS